MDDYPKYMKEFLQAYLDCASGEAVHSWYDPETSVRGPGLCLNYRTFIEEVHPDENYECMSMYFWTYDFFGTEYPFLQSNLDTLEIVHARRIAWVRDTIEMLDACQRSV